MDMSSYLDKTEDCIEELFNLYQVINGQWGDHALQEGQSKFLYNKYRQDLRKLKESDSEEAKIFDDKIKLSEKTHYENKAIADAYDITRRLIAGAILQIAKQGLSTVYKKSNNFPKNSKIYNISVSEIILAGRNQSMHFEEGKMQYTTKVIFDNLARFDKRFKEDEVTGKNMSVDVLQLLRWDGIEAYRETMMNL